MVNALTVDLEDWYQGIEIDISRWQGYESRIEESTVRLLNILSEGGVKGTFFVLGYVAERYPELVARVARERHEIASHGYSHAFLYRQQPKEFARELEKSIDILERITGEKVLGYRAPYFSVTEESLWALDILLEKGLRYDSSIFPVNNYRYGILASPRFPYVIKSAGHRSLIEFPVSTINWGKINVPFGGGAYLRILPYWMIRRAIHKINSKGKPAILYLHPWELDPHHPRLRLPLRIKFPHYANLKSTEGKLRALIKDFEFVPLREVLEMVNEASNEKALEIDPLSGRLLRSEKSGTSKSSEQGRAVR